MNIIPGIGNIADEVKGDFTDIESAADGMFHVGEDGVLRILTPRDRKVEFICFEDKTLTWVKSAMGYPALYPLHDMIYEQPAEAVLMDLDGTSVHSEEFWVWVIQATTARLLTNPRFELEEDDLPHVSGHSVGEHLQYCINKYCPGAPLEHARTHYYEITHHELREISEGRGRSDAFTPAPGLKEFLLELKGRGVRIGLVTSGLYEKAWPEIISAFRTMKLGDPLEFYDAIITAGSAIRKGQAGTLGELEPKPHPWLYAETAKVGLGMDFARRNRVLGFEDSAAGVVSLRLAGFAAVGVDGGNIRQSGVRPLLYRQVPALTDAIPTVFGE